MKAGLSSRKLSDLFPGSGRQEEGAEKADLAYDVTDGGGNDT